jgi:hypothetical protein
MIVSGRLARPAGPLAPGRPRPCRPCTNAAVGVRVMAPRRATAGLAAAQMVQPMAAGACACSAAIASAAGAWMVFRSGSVHGRRERLDAGRRMLPHSGGGDLDRALAGARVVVPDVVAGADDSGQRGSVSSWLRSTAPDSGWMRQNSGAGRAASIPCAQPLVPTGPQRHCRDFFESYGSSWSPVTESNRRPSPYHACRFRPTVSHWVGLPQVRAMVLSG